MTKMMCLVALCIVTRAFGQTADRFTAFRAQKKSIVLATGITMKYIDTGNPTGTPVILLHGSTDTGRSFEPTIEELVRINGDLRIIAPDLRGHGETTLPDEKACAGAPELCFTPAAFAADIIALMDRQHIGKAHFVGHSMGSVIAQELALKHANRVQSVVLIGTFVNGKECRSIHDFMIATIIEGQFKPVLQSRKHFTWPRDAYRVTPEELGPRVTGFLKANWVVEMATEVALLDAIYRETIRVPVGTWIGMMTALGKVDNRAALRDLRVPALVLHACQDMVITAPDQAQVKAALRAAAQRHGTPIIYKTYGKTPLPASGQQESDLGHNLQWAAPRQVAADVSAFIRSGVPVVNLPYINPKNVNEVLTEAGNADIVSYGPQK